MTTRRCSALGNSTTSWDFNPHQLIDVRVMSNAPKVELLLNNASFGLQALEHQTGNKLIADWQIPFFKGHLHAVAYDEENQIIAIDNTYSFEDSAFIELIPDKNSFLANGENLIFVTLRTLDSNGYPVENANNRMHISVKGAGRLVGLDNGDSTDLDSYKCSSRRLFSGKLLAIIASTLDPGPITLSVSSPSLPTASIVFHAVAPTSTPVVSAQLSCYESAINNEFPVRKIEITSSQAFYLECLSK
ncbi:MAG: DUF4982 domain-containing protein [Lachnotalea sp.]